MEWFQALKLYGEKGNSWHIPAKGTDAYKEIKSIQEHLKTKRGLVESAMKPEAHQEHHVDILEKLVGLKNEGVKMAEDGHSAESLAEYFNKKIMPKLQEYEMKYGAKKTTMIMNTIHSAMVEARRHKEAGEEPKKEEEKDEENEELIKEPKKEEPKKKEKMKITADDYTRDELFEIVKNHRKKQFRTFKSGFSKGQLLSIIRVEKIPLE